MKWSIVKPIEGRMASHYKTGELPPNIAVGPLTFNLIGRQGSIPTVGVTPASKSSIIVVRDDGRYISCHPHTNWFTPDSIMSDSKACLGEASKPLMDFTNNVNIIGVIITMKEWAQTIHIEDGWASEKLHLFPEWDKLKTYKKYNQG